MTDANPSLDPANTGTLTGTLRHVFTKMLQGIDGALPAKVVAFDRAANRAQVQPLIAVLTTSSTQVARAQIASVPVVQMGGGGFVMNFNLNPGDLGWIVASDRDISLFLQYYKDSPPNTYRIKNFADSFFIPDVLTGFTVAPEDAGNAVLQSLDGSVKISLGSDTITISAPNVVCNASVSAEVNAPTITATASETLTADAPIINLTADTLNLNVNGFGFTGSATQMTIDSPVPVLINQSVYVQGEIIATGNITANSPLPPP